MTGSRARVLGALPAERPVTSRPDPDERERLAATLGALLSSLRLERGMGTRLLARRAAVARSTIRRLEAGERRPRRSLLAGIAYGLCPDDPPPIIDALAAAAGDSLVPESSWSERRRRRAIDQAILSGASPLPESIGVPLALHQRADALYQQALSMFDEPGALDDGRKLAEITRLMDRARALGEEAGPPLVLHIGGRRISAGFRHP
jgi:transcriptional regulator with XRE-family HTH domain